jgi:hypothetical protein
MRRAAVSMGIGQAMPTSTMVDTKTRVGFSELAVNEVEKHPACWADRVDARGLERFLRQ